MTTDEYASQIEQMVRDTLMELGVAGDVSTFPKEPERGPFVELRSPQPSNSPGMSIHVFGVGNVAVTIGESASADWEDSPQAMLSALQVLLADLVQGRLFEEVGYDRHGKVKMSKLHRRTNSGSERVWTGTSGFGISRLSVRERQVRNFDPYPLSSDD